MAPNVITAREETFHSAVIERSFQTPVLVDFWAPWCGPCRTLTPTLEELAAQGEGQWLLAKVNTDENQALATRYGVRGIPNVKLFRDGAIVDEFVGAQPKHAVRKFLDKWVPDREDERVTSAEAQLTAGNADEARATLEDVLSGNAAHERARLALARLELDKGNGIAALAQLEHLPPGGPHRQAADKLRAQARLAPAPHATAREALQARLADTPNDLATRYDLALAEANAGDHASALDNLLSIIESDRTFASGAAHKAMLDLFTLLGEDDPLTAEYRQRLSWLLFS